MDDVCNEVGLSKGAVYGYFKSKDDIVSALKVESVQRYAGTIRRATQSREPEDALSLMFSEAAGSAANAGSRTDMLAWESRSLASDY